MSKTVVSSDNAPAAIGPYSPGIQTGNMVFLSGQLGIDPQPQDARGRRGPG